MGDVLDPSLQWQGYAPGASTVSTIKITDFFDCDGTKGVNALLLDASATWCGPCNMEADSIPTWMSGSWGKDGVKVVTLMIQDENRNKATTMTAQAWISAHSLTSIDVCADPDDSLGMGFMGIPANFLIDPRTMKIVSETEGTNAPDADPAVDQLALKNKK